ncbi:hypothetical protein [Nocardia blacklockiae]|uniref:hypothetical protein n=1 Tax=Nocardia blacklockiae TaxID=480036 RepID=UPI001E3A0752|nr:hypothetical protein [Nocardia blacklockiae]
MEDITVGPFAHGFGRTGEGRPFAFRTVEAALTLEIYRPGTATVPGPEDVVAVATAAVTDIDLGDARSLTAAVRDLIAAATPVPGAAEREATTARTLLGRLSAVIDSR